MSAPGEFDFEPLFAILDDAIRPGGVPSASSLTPSRSLGAFFGDDVIVRSELNRLMRWLERNPRDVTVIMTWSGSTPLTRHGIEEYVTDCVITLDHRVSAGISTVAFA